MKRILLSFVLAAISPLAAGAQQAAAPSAVYSAGGARRRTPFPPRCAAYLERQSKNIIAATEAMPGGQVQLPADAGADYFWALGDAHGELQFPFVLDDLRRGDCRRWTS